MTGGKRIKGRWLLGILVLGVLGVGFHRRDAGATGISGRKAVGGPRLIVLLVVDQMRADYLERFRERFGRDGFRRLEREGAVFTDCHYPYAGTVTAPGHATLATGTTPNRHGITDNSWYDWERQRVVLAIEDENHALVSVGNPKRPQGLKPEVLANHTCGLKPAPDRAAGTPVGESPCSLQAETLGDALKAAIEQNETRNAKIGNREGLKARGKGEILRPDNIGTQNDKKGAQQGQVKVYGVAWKAWAGILSAGKSADGVYWYDAQAGGFVTSTYYRNQLPRWLEGFNAIEVRSYSGQEWRSRRRILDTLPDLATNPSGYYLQIARTPYANELLVKLAERVVVKEGLGKDDATDLLALSLSANDYAGHRWGPYSEEVEEMTVATDQQVARLLRFLDKRVGKGRYWVAVSSDHGVAPTLAQARAQGLAAKSVSQHELSEKILGALTSRWGRDAWLVARAGGIVFNRETLTRRGVSVEEAGQVVGEAAMQVDGVMGYAVAGKAVPGNFSEAFALSYYPGRAPDVELLLEPYALIEGERGETTHGTPHGYDTHVPLILFGPAFRAGVYADRVSPADLVPTLAAAMGIKAPAMADGRVLSQALHGKQ